MNGIDKFVRDAMPIQEEEKASGKPAAKETNTEVVINKWLRFAPIKQRPWIDIETQESKDPYCFQVSKFINRLLRHSKQVYREEDGGVHYDQVIDECKKKQSDNTGYWSDDMRMLQIDISSGKRWRTEEKVSTEVHSILHCKTMYCCQKVLPSFFNTSGTEKN